jgi:predicted MFS family arabinose efflux permease
MVALTTGVGILLGSQLGGQLGDRIGHRAVLQVALLSSSVVVVPLTMLPTIVTVAATLNIVLTALIGARTVTHGALLTGQLSEARATVMSIFSSMTAGSAVLGAAIGGALVDAAGFWLLGAFCATTMGASAALLHAWRARLV